MSTPSTTAAQGDEGTHHPPPTSVLAVTAVRYARWGWLTRQVGDRLLLTTNHLVSAVELPTALGGQVQHYLRVRMLAGPVIVLPGTPRRWVLLTQSADESAPVSIAQLRGRGVSTHHHGALVPLPPSRLGTGLVTWQVSPSADDPSLPPYASVVAAVRAVTETTGVR
jgi:hypothetical protein